MMETAAIDIVSAAAANEVSAEGGLANSSRVQAIQSMPYP